MLIPLQLDVVGHGRMDQLPLHPDDFLVSLCSDAIDGTDYLLLLTHEGRRFVAEANDAGGLTVHELVR